MNAPLRQSLVSGPAYVLPDAQGIYHSAALSGFWLRLDWLRQPPTLLSSIE